MNGRTQVVPEMCFNSILVRLKAPHKLVFYPGFKGFNSILVRLKDENRFKISNYGTCFNSILVRLKEQAGESSDMHKGVSIPFWYG